MLTEDQRAARQKGLGGSDIGGIFNVSPWATPFSIYMSKVGDLEPDTAGKPAQFGHIMEDPILSMYELQTGMVVTRAIPTQYHPKYEFLFANVDGMRSDGVLVEAKNVDPRYNRGPYKGKAWGIEGTDQIPVHYLLQVAHYCMIMDCAEADIAAYFGGSDLRIYKYHRNPCVEASILEMTYHFWTQHVLTRTPPLQTATSTDLNAMWLPQEDESSVYVTDEIAPQLQLLSKVRAQKKELEITEEAAKRAIMLAMRDKSVLRDHENNVLATWKDSTRTNMDLPRLRKAHPDIAQEFSITKATRILRVKGETNE